jgi:Putative transposase of IS4/5 family (DUF4096)
VTPPRRSYATDLTDAEWQLLAPFIPEPKPGGRPPIHDRRELVNAMAYWLGPAAPGGCCPMTCRPGRPSTLLALLAAAGRVGTGPRHPPRPGALRQSRPSTPSAAILDSQSVKTTVPGAPRLRRRQAGQRPQAPPLFVTDTDVCSATDEIQEDIPVAACLLLKFFTEALGSGNSGGGCGCLGSAGRPLPSVFIARWHRASLLDGKRPGNRFTPAPQPPGLGIPGAPTFTPR